MISKALRKFTNTAEKRRLANNIISLSVLQGASYILPLLTVPYLVRVLGPEYFGLLAFSTATIAYLMLLTDYGFNLSATQQISIHRDSQEKINDIFSSVIIIKVGLVIISIGILSMLIFSFEKFSQHWRVYYLTFGAVVGQALFPVWLFQGMERMRYITYLNLGSKAFFTVCVFVFVKEKSDYLIVPLLNSLGFIVAGVCSLFLVRSQFGVSFRSQSFEAIKFQIKDGWHIFLSSMAISLYTISTAFILGITTNNFVVGYFAAAEKIVQAVKGIYTPISQAIYPLISKKIYEDRIAGLIFIRKVAWIVGSGMLAISSISFIFSEPIVYVLLGEQYEQSILLLRIMAFVPFVVALSNIFGIQMMLNMGYKKEFTFFILVTAFLSVLMVIMLAGAYEAVGVSVAILLVEILITTMLALFVYVKWKKGAL